MHSSFRAPQFHRFHGDQDQRTNPSDFKSFQQNPNRKPRQSPPEEPKKSKEYSKLDIGRAFKALSKVFGKNSVVAIGSCAEVLRGGYQTANIRQFVILHFHEDANAWLENNGVSLELRKPGGQFGTVFAMTTEHGVLYHDLVAPFEVRSDLYSAYIEPETGTPYPTFELNQAIWNYMGFHHPKVEAHFELVNNFINEFEATEQDVRIMFLVKDYITRDVKDRHPDVETAIREAMSQSPKADKWIETFNQHLSEST